MKKLSVVAAAALLAASIGGNAYAGSIYLTGHDTLLHGGQNGYDGVILDFLRGAGTGSEVAKASYSIAVIGGGAGSGSFTGGPTITGGVVPDTGKVIPTSGGIAGYESLKYYIANATTDWASVLAHDVMIVLSHTNCGGCDMTDASSGFLNAQAAGIATAFNAGMDIWGNSGANLATFYNFLPASAATSGLPISGSSGFTATAAGAALGILPGMINGFPTHNRFTGFAPAFTVCEERLNSPSTTTDDEVISLCVRDARIVVDGGTDGVVVDDGGTGVPEPGTLALLGLAALGAGVMRRRKTS